MNAIQTLIAAFIIGCLIGGIGTYTKTYSKYQKDLQTEQDKYKKLKGDVEEKTKELQDKIKKQNEEKVKAIGDLNESIKKNDKESKARIDNLLNSYRKLALSSGLYDNGIRTGPSGNGKDSTSCDSGGNNSASGGQRLSDAASGFLLEKAGNADKVVDQYLNCQSYVIKLREICNR